MSRLFDALRASDQDLVSWYLKTNDNVVYGPVTIGTLAAWAAQNRITPGNQISANQKEWVPAQECPELKMEWVAPLRDGREYGPFNMLAAPHMVRDGHIQADCTLTNRTTGERVPIRELLDAEDRQLGLDKFLELTVGEHEPTDRPSRHQPLEPEGRQPSPAAEPLDTPQLPLNLAGAAETRKHTAAGEEAGQGPPPRQRSSGKRSDDELPEVQDRLLEEIERLNRLLTTEREQAGRLKRKLADRDRRDDTA